MDVLLAIKLVRRFRRSPRRTLVRFTSAAAVAGLALGIAALIIAQSLARGFQGELQTKLLTNTAHITVARTDRTAITNWRSDVTHIREIAGVTAVRAEHSEPAILIGPRSAEYAVLRVIDSGGIAAGGGRARITVGNELAKRTGTAESATQELVTFNNMSSPVKTPVLVTGEFSTGIYEYDASWVRMDSAEYARMRGSVEFVPTSLNVSVTDIYEASEAAERIRQIIGPDYFVLDWQDANRPLFAALSLEKKAATAVIWLIIIIAALNITTTLALLVHERRIDIAVLRTCGAGTKYVVSLFVLEGMMLAAIGIVTGIALGISSCVAANKFRWLSTPADVYTLSYIPLRPELVDTALAALAAFAVALIATFYPAIKAAGVKPMESLRDQ